MLWLHASSVGEVQAAILLIGELQRTEPNLRLVLTSMTEQGNRLARARLPQSVTCLMAPLDLLPAVRRALRLLRPDLYVCLETELWPTLLTEARRAHLPMLLLNGRLSQRSLGRYRRIGRYIASLLAGFHTLAVIGETDGRRFAALGVPERRIRVCGNIKYDMPVGDPEAVRRRSREWLGVQDAIVLLCGSTHEGEEEQLLPVLDRMSVAGPAVLVIAPRHLRRLATIRDALARTNTAYTLFSQLPEGGGAARVILVDTMGDLADLYAGCKLHGIPARTAISEYAPGQVEITLEHGDALQAMDQTVRYKPFKAREGETDVVVKTEVLQPGGQPIQLDYALEKDADTWKVFDVVVAGVSLVTNYRDTFNQEVRTNGVDGLIKMLVDKNKQLEAGKK